MRYIEFFFCKIMYRIYCIVDNFFWIISFFILFFFYIFIFFFIFICCVTLRDICVTCHVTFALCKCFTLSLCRFS